MIQAMQTPEQHENRGRDLVWTGQLTTLRVRLGFTRGAMAELLHMSPVTYNRCEDLPGTANSMWSSTAERLGRFSWLAEKTLADMDTINVTLSDYTPLHLLAMTHGLPQEVLLKWYREGVIQAEDLGVLGLWVHKDDEYLLNEGVCP